MWKRWNGEEQAMFYQGVKPPAENACQGKPWTLIAAILRSATYAVNDQGCRPGPAARAS